MLDKRLNLVKKIKNTEGVLRKQVGNNEVGNRQVINDLQLPIFLSYSFYLNSIHSDSF